MLRGFPLSLRCVHTCRCFQTAVESAPTFAIGAGSLTGDAAALRISMRLSLLKWGLASLLLIGPATFSAQAQTASQDANKAGRDAKTAGRNAGNAAKHTGEATAKTSKRAARRVKRGAKSTVNQGAKQTEKGAQKVQRKTQ